MMDAEKTVLVAVRSRPLLKKGEESYNPSLLFSENEVSIQDKAFSFDYIFPPDTTNFHVFNSAVANRLPRVFEGYNLTIFAYGQTGSGKTYTMGTNYPPVLQNESGIILLSVTRIFEDIKQRGDNYKFTVNVSFLEVYKEDVYDLLSKKKTVCQIREDFEGVKVVNLTEVPVNSIQEVLSVLEQGCQARCTASTAMNEHSSRSHSLFILSIEQINKVNLETKKSKFQLVDLAGSERVDQSKTEGIRFKEGVDINKGLLALGKVISALSDGKSHIPYRDSRLTRLLMDSLGGNSYTLMIACISPSANNSDETISTLRYASRARKIKNKPVINNDPPDVQIQKLKQQVELLRTQLYKKSCSFEDVSGSSCEEHSDLKEQNNNLQNELQNSLVRITVLNESLNKVEEKFELMNGKISELLQQIQSCIDKCDVPYPTLSITDILINLKDIEDKLKELVSKSSLNLVAEMDHTKAFSSFKPTVNITNAPSGSETSSEDDISSDMEVAEIDRKLEKVELRLLKKQEMAQQFEVINDAIESSSVQNINTLQEKIDNLVKEKKELELALQKSEKMLCDERNKRYADCQSEIKALEKELLRTKLFKKIKEENKMKMENLQREIQSLKSTKVKVQKKMKAENDNFRRMQIAKDREVEKLKKNERKKDFEMLKLRNNFDKQVNAFKQKIEKFQSLNKRLNEALSRQKNSHVLLKNQKISKQHMEMWLMKEVEVEALKQMASSEYIAAKENMGQLTEEANDIGSSDPLLLLSIEVEKLENEKRVQKQLNSGENNIERWKTINSMIDAKTALSVLFEKCIDGYIKANYDCGTNSSAQKVLKTTHKEYEQEHKNMLAQIKSLKDKVIKMKKEKCEQDIKMVRLLKEMSDYEKCLVENHSESDLFEKIQSQFCLQKFEIEEFAKKFEEYNKLREEVEYWKEECKKQKISKRGRKYLSSVYNHSSQEPNSTQSMTCEYLMEEPADDSFQNLDDNTDPDWRMTPVHKQRKRLREYNKNTEVFENEELPHKRSFSSCNCPGECKTSRCACRKKKKMCDSSCTCNHNICLNGSEEKSVF